MNTLTELGLKYNTDKAGLHGYTEIYERYLAPMRETALQVLEIGVAQGASIRMWAEYFSQALIVGIDHNPIYMKMPEMPANACLLLLDASEPQTWRTLAEAHSKFDLIVDDGSHYSRHIIAAFNGGWPLVKPGGLYIVEDLHQIWVQEKPFGETETAYEFFSAKMIMMQEGGAGQCGRPTTGDIAFVHFYKSLVIVGKR